MSDGIRRLPEEFTTEGAPMAEHDPMSGRTKTLADLAVFVRQWEAQQQNAEQVRETTQWTQQIAEVLGFHPRPLIENQPKEDSMTINGPGPQRRLVRIFVLDPDPRLPADMALVYATCATPNPKGTLTAADYNADIAAGEVVCTDLTDEQLLIGLPGLQAHIVAHNVRRSATSDLEATRIHGGCITLGPVTIADLVTRVVTVASVALREGR